MAKLFLTSINLYKNELQNAAIHNLGAEPGTPATGQIYFDTNGGNNKLRYYDSAQWVTIEHDSTVLGFVANEHIDHSGVSITAGVGLSGGGNITTTRTINLDLNDAGLLEATALITTDKFAIYDSTNLDTRYITYANLLTELGGDLDFTQYTFENGLTETTGTVKLGGALTATTSITGNFTLNRTVTDGTIALHVENQASGGAAGEFVGVSKGIYASASNAGGIAADISSSAGTGATIVSLTNNFYGAIIGVQNADTTTIDEALLIRKNISAAGGNGAGTGIDFKTYTSTSSSQTQSKILTSWTDATHATRTAKLSFQTTDNAVTATKMEVAGSGQLTLSTYGSGTFTGTPAKFLAVTAAGLVIEENTPSGNAYSTVTGDTGTASATGQETVNFTGGDAIITTVTAGATDDVKIDLDINGVTDRTAFTTGDKLVIYEAGVGIRKIDYSDLPGAAGASSYVTINGNSGTTSAGVSDTLALLGSNGITTTASEPGTDQVLFELGGTLTKNTTIDGSTDFTLTITGTDAVEVFAVDNTSGNGNAISASATGSGAALYAENSGSGAAVNAIQSGTGVGVTSTTSAGIAGLFTSLSTSSFAAKAVMSAAATTTLVDVVNIQHNTSATAGDGFGAGLTFTLESAAGTDREAAAFDVSWTTAADATRTSKFQLQLVDTAATQTVLDIAGSGQVQLSQYGSGTFTGTDVYWLAVDSSGNIIEEAAPSFAANAYSTITGDTGTASATGEETFQIIGGTGMVTTVATGSPDNVTVDIDVNSTVDFSSSTPTWTFGNETTGEGLFVTGTPVDGNHVVNKTYVDNLAAGLSGKDSVRVATTVAGTLATDFENGDTIDGVVLATGNRILIKNQASAAENGIYIVEATGAPTRASDADSWDELVSAYVWVEEGTTNADSGWLCTVDTGGTLGVTAVTWVLFASATSLIAGDGLTKTGNTIDAVAATNGGLVMAANDMSIDASNLTSLGAAPATDDTLIIYDTDGAATKKITVAQLQAAGVRKYVETTVALGGGTPDAIVHNLGTKDVMVSIRNEADDAQVEADIVCTDTNTVTITSYGAAITATVTVIG